MIDYTCIMNITDASSQVCIHMKDGRRFFVTINKHRASISLSPDDSHYPSMVASGIFPTEFDPH